MEKIEAEFECACEYGQFKLKYDKNKTEIFILLLVIIASFIAGLFCCSIQSLRCII